MKNKEVSDLYHHCIPMLDLVSKAPWSTLHLCTLLFIFFSYSYVVYLLIYLVYIFACCRVFLTCAQIDLYDGPKRLLEPSPVHPSNTNIYSRLPLSMTQDFVLGLGQENYPKKGPTIINHKEHLTVKLLLKMNNIINIKIKLNMKELKYNFKI